MKMNNSGDISITILVIGVFAICTLAVLSFVVSNVTLKNSFESVGYVEYTNLQYEESQFNENNIGEFYNEKNLTKFSLDYIQRGFRDELEFSVKYNPLE